MDLAVFEGIADGAPPLRINLPSPKVSPQVVGHLKKLLVEHPGDSSVFLHLGPTQVLRLPDEFCVDLSTGLAGSLRELLGADCLA
jgi:DNA polymerase-3 subunit alpha